MVKLFILYFVISSLILQISLSRIDDNKENESNTFLSIKYNDTFSKNKRNINGKGMKIQKVGPFIKFQSIHHLEIYENVMEALDNGKKYSSNLLSFPWSRPEFTDKSFWTKIHKIIESKSKRRKHFLMKDSCFKHDLIRLFFKWILYMRSEMEFEEFNEFLDSIKSDYDYLKEYFPDEFFDHHLEYYKFTPQNKYVLEGHLDLLNLEFLERKEEMIQSFHSVINTFYGFDNSAEGVRSNCQVLKDMYFDGDFKNNLVLMGTIYLFVHSEDEINKCFGEITPPPEGWKLKLATIPLDDFNKPLGNSVYGFLNQRLLNLFMKGNKGKNESDKNYIRIRMEDHSDFIHTLKALERIGSLNMKTIKTLFGFYDPSLKLGKKKFFKLYPYGKWNDQKFKEFRDDCGMAY